MLMYDVSAVAYFQLGYACCKDGHGYSINIIGWIIMSSIKCMKRTCKYYSSASLFMVMWKSKLPTNQLSTVKYTIARKGAYYLDFFEYYFFFTTKLSF